MTARRFDVRFTFELEDREGIDDRGAAEEVEHRARTLAELSDWMDGYGGIRLKVINVGHAQLLRPRVRR